MQLGTIVRGWRRARAETVYTQIRSAGAEEQWLPQKLSDRHPQLVNLSFRVTDSVEDLFLDSRTRWLERSSIHHQPAVLLFNGHLSLAVQPTAVELFTRMCEEVHSSPERRRSNCQPAFGDEHCCALPPAGESGFLCSEQSARCCIMQPAMQISTKIRGWRCTLRSSCDKGFEI